MALFMDAHTIEGGVSISDVASAHASHSCDNDSADIAP